MRPTDKLNHPSIVTEILRCEVGSTAHGVNVPGTDDFDMMGVAIEVPECLLGLQSFEQVIYRTATERDGRQGTRSMPGDIDLCVYSLRKFAKLAAKGNPSVMLLLWAPVIFENWVGRRLRDMRHLFVSKASGKRFLGYLQAQKQRMTGERGGKDVKRPELVEKYGFDTKYAMHALRLGYQGVTLMDTGNIPVPVAPHMQEYLIAVRNGKLSEEACLTHIGWLEEGLKDAIEHSRLPEQADYPAINNLLVNLYERAWQNEL